MDRMKILYPHGVDCYCTLCTRKKEIEYRQDRFEYETWLEEFRKKHAPKPSWLNTEKDAQEILTSGVRRYSPEVT